MIQPPAEESPECRIADCGCILAADIPPVGYRWKLTTLGSVRTPVFACEQHFHPGPLSGPTPAKVAVPARTGVRPQRGSHRSQRGS